MSRFSGSPGLGVARVLEQVLLDHQPGETWDDTLTEHAATCWCGWEAPPEYFSWRWREWHRKHVADHLAAAITAYLAGEPRG